MTHSHVSDCPFLCECQAGHLDDTPSKWRINGDARINLRNTLPWHLHHVRLDLETTEMLMKRIPAGRGCPRTILGVVGVIGMDRFHKV